MTPTPRLQARAFAIWRYANPRGWNVTYEEISEATGLTANQISKVVTHMGWAGRIKRWTSHINSQSLLESGQNYQIQNLTQIFRNTSLTSAQEFGIDWS